VAFRHPIARILALFDCFERTYILNIVCKNRADSIFYDMKPYVVRIDIKYGIKMAVLIHRENYVIVG